MLVIKRGRALPVNFRSLLSIAHQNHFQGESNSAKERKNAKIKISSQKRRNNFFFEKPNLEWLKPEFDFR